MSREKDSGGRSRAVVVAPDEALRLSLVILLEVSGWEVVALEDANQLPAICHHDEKFIIIDSPDGGRTPEIKELRRLGWQGSVIFMTGNEPMLEKYLADKELEYILVKPFSSEDLLDIIRK